VTVRPVVVLDAESTLKVSDQGGNDMTTARRTIAAAVLAAVALLGFAAVASSPTTDGATAMGRRF
jgi:hypothetical protein